MSEWRWPRAGKIKFAHLQFDSTVYDWQGAQITLICFDELTHFSRHQFFYMVSRNRSTCGVKPYIRATCNPDADSWVADFLAWWIDPESGLPIAERSGVLRYYIRVAETIMWADRPEELMQDLPRPGDLPPGIAPPRPISVTFIPARVFDNPVLLQVNPEYFAWLLSLPLLERERLLGGNWKIRPAAGLYFKREWCAVGDEVPGDLDVVRYWDLAATEKTEFNDPDWTIGIKLGRDRNRGYWLLDMAARAGKSGRHRKIAGQRYAVAGRVWKTAPKNVGNLMGKRARCGVLRWISSQGVWRDDLDLTMWSGNEVLKAAIGDGNCPSNQSIDADALMSLIRLDRRGDSRCLPIVASSISDRVRSTFGRETNQSRCDSQGRFNEPHRCRPKWCSI